MIIQGFFKFHDFSIYGTFLMIFQVFHDFQCLWEPEIWPPHQRNNGNCKCIYLLYFLTDFNKNSAKQFWSINFVFNWQMLSCNSLPPGKLFHAFLSPAFFFKINFFEKFFQGYHHSVKQIGSDILSALIWIQSVCKVYEQMALENYHTSYQRQRGSLE